MPSYITDALCLVRFHFYFIVLAACFCSFPYLILPWFGLCVMLYPDEDKAECLDFEDWLEETLEAWVPLELFEDVYTYWNKVAKYYHDKGQRLPDDLLFSDQQEADVSPSSDFLRQSIEAQMWDSPDGLGLQEILEIIHDEWEYESETTIDQSMDLKDEDLEHYYMFLRVNQRVDPSIRENTVLMSSIWRRLPPVLQRKTSRNLIHSVRSTPIENQSLLFDFFQNSRTDDFRFRYWRRYHRQRRERDAAAKKKFNAAAVKTQKI